MRLRLIAAICSVLACALSPGLASEGCGANLSNNHGQGIPFGADVFDMRVADIDGDGRLDLALTTHGDNYTQVFRQIGTRNFMPGPINKDVGFHPGALIPLKLLYHHERRFLMNAEGRGEIQVLEGDDAGGLRLIGAIKVPVPRYSVEFNWPAGPGLAIAPFDLPGLILSSGIENDATNLRDPHILKMPSELSTLGQIVASDLNGDGFHELLLPDGATHTIWVVRAPSGSEAPRAEPLWVSTNKMLFDRVVAGDVDGDGDMDLLVPENGQYRPARGLQAQTRRNPMLVILINDGTGQFTLASPVSFPGQEPAWSIADVALGVDDGIPYMLASSNTGLALLRMDKLSDCGAPLAQMIPVESSGVVARVQLDDLDGDGSLDAILGYGGPHGGAFILYGPLWDNFATLKGAMPQKSTGSAANVQ